jgi:hypothetical protein
VEYDELNVTVFAGISLQSRLTVWECLSFFYALVYYPTQGLDLDQWLRIRHVGLGQRRTGGLLR